MRKFSRWMPPTAERPMTLAGWLVLAGLAAATVAAAIAWPIPAGLLLFAFVLWTYAVNRAGNSHLWRLAAERTGENIGTFARAFDRRAEPFDPRVVRAAWDALEPYVEFRGGHVPLRPADRLVKDLRIDPDDIDFDLIREVAQRSGRSLAHTKANPYYGHVETVGDFVKFVTCQPPAVSQM